MINIKDKPLDYIGEGGNWTVYKCDYIYKSKVTIVVKVPKNSDKIRKNIFNFKLIKNIGLPTVDFLEKGIVDGRYVLITEYFNHDNVRYFISPNSVVTKKELYFNALIGVDLKKSLNEDYFYNNRKSSIINLHDFINKVKKDLMIVSQNKIVLPWDCYFFSIPYLENDVELDYIIADWDNVEQSNIENTDVLLKENLNNFKESIIKFIEHFIIDDDIQKTYIDLIDNQI